MELQGPDLLSQLEQVKTGKTHETVIFRHWMTGTQDAESWENEAPPAATCRLRRAPGAGPGPGGRSCVSAEQRGEAGQEELRTLQRAPANLHLNAGRACVWGSPRLGKGPPERNTRSNTWGSPHWVVVLPFSYTVELSKILFRIFAPMFTKGIWSVVFFPSCAFFWFWYQDDVCFKEQCEKLFSLIFRKSLCRNWYYFFPKYWVKITNEALYAWRFLCGKVSYHSFLISLLCLKVIFFFLSEL